jgi:hypothetical protein
MKATRVREMHGGCRGVGPHEGEGPCAPDLWPVEGRGSIQHALGVTPTHDEQELLALVTPHEQRGGTVDHHLLAEARDGGGDAVPGGIVDLDGGCGIVSHGGFNGTAPGPIP